VRCEKCHGVGRVRVWLPQYYPSEMGGMGWDTCWDCQGSGITHCCDGLCEQPEASK
jgi:hypothetical protein